MSDPYIFEQLNTKTLESVTASDIQSLTNPTHLEFENQFDLERYNLINKAVMRDGRPIPATSVIIQVAATESGTPVVVKLPENGEVWEILNAHIETSGGSGSVAHKFFWNDQNNSRNFMWYFFSSTSSDLTLQQDSDWKPPFFFDQNQSFTYSATGTFTTSTLSVLMIRVR
jgi:hypothetical protein